MELTSLALLGDYESEKPEKPQQDDDDDDPPVQDFDPTEYDRYKEHNELTFRSIVVGCLIGVLVAAMNVNFGLRTGVLTSLTKITFK
jgi:hypothetical protein